MKVTAGRYTLGITTVICGLAMLLNIFFDLELSRNLWLYSPVVVIMLGLEMLFLSRRNSSGSIKIQLGAGNVILIASVIAILMVGTAKIEFDSRMLKNIYELAYYVIHRI